MCHKQVRKPEPRNKSSHTFIFYIHLRAENLIKVYQHSRIIAIIMLLTFFVSGVEGYCFQTTQTANEIAGSVLSFENNELDHTLEATINESVPKVSNSLSLSDNLRIKFSTPDLLSFIKSTTTGNSISTYKKTVSSIYFSNHLFLIFSHFNI